MQHIVVFDLDGTLADCEHRRGHIANPPKNWKAFFDAMMHDTPMLAQIKLAHAFSDCGYEIVYLTGRPERYRDETLAWMHQHKLPSGKLHMRQEADRSAAPDYKRRVLQYEIGFGSVALVVDDDPRVCAMLTLSGVPNICPNCK